MDHRYELEHLQARVALDRRQSRIFWLSQIPLALIAGVLVAASADPDQIFQIVSMALILGNTFNLALFGVFRWQQARLRAKQRRFWETYDRCMRLVDAQGMALDRLHQRVEYGDRQ